MHTGETGESCTKARIAVRDTLDVVGGKWKLVLLTILMNGKKRFGELAREAEISPRILSKELHELEMHGLVSRTVQKTKPVTVEYAVTPYSNSLSGVLEAMKDWGLQHRARAVSKSNPVQVSLKDVSLQ